MAARLTPATSRGSALLLAVTMAAACGGGSGVPLQPGQPRPTPLASLPADLARTVGTIRDRITNAGFRLEEAVREYRPPEPAALQATPRAVLRIGLPERDAGWLLIYHLAGEEEADAAASSFAEYLAGNFGQARYPPDAQFLLNRVNSSLLFGWWAPSRMTDPDAARAAYDALRSLGQPITIR